MDMNKKYLMLSQQLQTDGYTVEYITKADAKEILYLAVEYCNRKIILHYDKDLDVFDIGQIAPESVCEYCVSNPNPEISLGYSYMFKQYTKNILPEYWESLGINPECPDYVCCRLSNGYLLYPEDYALLFSKWIKQEQYTLHTKEVVELLVKSNP